MNALLQATAIVKQHEGLRLLVYVIDGHETIGFGRDMRSEGITEAEADYLLQNDLVAAHTFLQTFTWYGNLTSNQVAALLDMVYNLGKRGFEEFKTMIACLASGDYAGAAAAMQNSLWAKQVGQRALDDATLMRSSQVQ